MGGSAGVEASSCAVGPVAGLVETVPAAEPATEEISRGSQSELTVVGLALALAVGAILPLTTEALALGRPGG